MEAKHFWLGLLLIFVGGVGWRIGGSLSSDAFGMAIGILFGIMAGIPTALLVLASEHRHEDVGRVRERQRQPRIDVRPVVPPQITNNYITNNYIQLPPQKRDRLAEIEERHQTNWSLVEH